MAKHKANRTQDPRPLVVAWRSSGLSVEEYAFRSGLDTRALRALRASDTSHGAGNVDGIASTRPVVVELDLASAGLAASAPSPGVDDRITLQTDDLLVTLPMSATIETITTVIEAMRRAR